MTDFLPPGKWIREPYSKDSVYMTLHKIGLKGTDPVVNRCSLFNINWRDYIDLLSVL